MNQLVLPARSARTPLDWASAATIASPRPRSASGPDAWRRGGLGGGVGDFAGDAGPPAGFGMAAQGEADRFAVAVLGGVGDQFGGQQLGIAGQVLHPPGGECLADRGAGLPGRGQVGGQLGPQDGAVGLGGLVSARSWRWRQVSHGVRPFLALRVLVCCGGEPGIAVAAAGQAEPAGGFGDRPAQGAGAVIGCGVHPAAELAPGGADEAGDARAAGGRGGEVRGHAVGLSLRWRGAEPAGGRGQTRVAGHAITWVCWRGRGRAGGKSGAVPVPVAGRYRHQGR